jgi:predicted nucleic acid-binding protein
VKLVADANVLLSAVLGGRAALVLQHPEVEEVLTTGVTFAEVQEYAVVLGRKKRLPEEMLLLAVASLPVTIVSSDVYRAEMKQARRQLDWRDPDDVEILALALHLRIPLWSNDNDFEGCPVPWMTTAEVLRQLGISGGR